MAFQKFTILTLNEGSTSNSFNLAVCFILGGKYQVVLEHFSILKFNYYFLIMQGAVGVLEFSIQCIFNLLKFLQFLRYKTLSLCSLNFPVF